LGVTGVIAVAQSAGPLLPFSTCFVRATLAMPLLKIVANNWCAISGHLGSLLVRYSHSVVVHCQSHLRVHATLNRQRMLHCALSNAYAMLRVQHYCETMRVLHVASSISCTCYVQCVLVIVCAIGCVFTCILHSTYILQVLCTACHILRVV
jgi:hypothetical protein